MGLDMYLSKKTYLDANYEHRKVKVDLSVKKDGEDVSLPIDNSKITSVEEHVMYWRKANAIHNWFVQNCQDGRDECQDTNVSVDDLKNLRDVCFKVLYNNDLAEELLPATSGFFFGSTEYDEWYFSSVQETLEVLTEIIRTHDGEKDGFYIDYVYSSSW